MNEVIIIQQKINDYTTTVKVDKSVKRFEVEFGDNSTKVAKIVKECSTTVSKCLKYIHELQNAYYISTGQELEVKL